MRKYLMTGVAALAICAAFTSCSKSGEELYNPEAISGMNKEKVVEEYNARFLAYVGGSIASDQDWGFGSAGTRSNPGDNYPATHTYANGGANVNANEWADPDKDFGGWVVPDPLTSGQKERVKAYFQANPNLDYEDPHYRHFFVQQVYKGGPETAGSNSTEVVTAADGSEYTSDNMNHLTVGQSNMHINNFNGGTCSTNDEVLKNGYTVNNAQYQSDEIMLMVNIDDTSCFGYHDSGSSNQSSDSPNHNDKMALVSAAVIDAWAAQNGNPGEAVVDKWNRSFMGFDLAIKEGAQAYATDDNGNVLYADYSQAPTSPVYGWDGEKIVEMGTFHTEQPEPSNPYWIVNVFDGYKDEYKNIMKGTEAIGWLTTNENFYIAADKVTLTDEYSNGEIPQSSLNDAALSNVLVFKDVQVPGATNNKAHVINLKRIKELVDAGYLPVKDKSLTEWVKVGVSDGYFSDWIVTLTKAERYTPPTPPTRNYTIRVLGEDLTFANTTSASGVAITDADDGADFDFNDVVFDVAHVSNGTADENGTWIRLMAAGGTLPLYIGSVAEANEVHYMFGQPITKMINTNAPSGISGLDPIEYKYSNGVVNAKDIAIIVIKDGIQFTLSAQRGEPASKIAVSKMDFQWPNERQSIKKKYPLFVEWAQGGQKVSDWWD
jgi:hypothetical protein